MSSESISRDIDACASFWKSGSAVVGAQDWGTEGDMIFLTHHKCASTLLHAWVAETCRINRLSFFTSHRGDHGPSAGHDISLLTNAVFGTVAAELGGGPAIHLIRNPLSIVVSAYHSHRATHDDAGWPELTAQRAILRGLGQAEGMMRTIAFCEDPAFYAATPGPLAQLASWDFDDPRIATIRMEDFGDDPAAMLRPAFGEAGRALTMPDAAGFAFRALSGGRGQGQVDDASHYRSGDPDAWRRELPIAARDQLRARYRALMERFYPEALID
jgi:hypothetical protein